MVHYIQEHLGDVLRDCGERIRLLKTVTAYDSLSTKLKSELISNMLEASFANVPDIVAPFSDSEPDLWVDGRALEIKTARTPHTWRGGEYSKRESDYLMVSYDDSDDGWKWFVLHTYLKESDWKSSGSSSYYATTIDMNHIIENTPYTILVGDTVKKKVKYHVICS